MRDFKVLFESVMAKITLRKCPLDKCLFSGRYGVGDPGPGRMVSVAVSAPHRRDYKLEWMTDAEWQQTIDLTAISFNAMRGMTVCSAARCGRHVSDDYFKDESIRTALYLHPPAGPNDSVTSSL